MPRKGRSGALFQAVLLNYFPWTCVLGGNQPKSTDMWYTRKGGVLKLLFHEHFWHKCCVSNDELSAIKHSLSVEFLSLWEWWSAFSIHQLFELNYLLSKILDSDWDSHPIFHFYFNFYIIRHIYSSILVFAELFRFPFSYKQRGPHTVLPVSESTTLGRPRKPECKFQT